MIRTAVTLASIFRRPIRVTNVRAKRSQPGLRPQHLQSVLVSAKLCNAVVTGAAIGSTEITFVPGKMEKSFFEHIDTGTAGSISLIAQTIVPISLFGFVELDVALLGGTEFPHSPTIYYIGRVVLPIYQRLGASVQIRLEKRGYYPRGGGIVKLQCVRDSASIPLVFKEDAERRKLASILSCSRMLPEHVSHRQLESAKARLSHEGVEIISTQIESGGRSISPGSSVLVYNASESNYVGCSALGEKGKRSEQVGEEAAQNFLKEIEPSPNVDSHLADMLVTLLCCVEGRSSFTTSEITQHFVTNLEVAKMITGCKAEYHKEGSYWRVRIVGASEKPN